MCFLGPLSRESKLLVLCGAFAVSFPACALQQTATKPDTPATTPLQATPQTTAKPAELPAATTAAATPATAAQKKRISPNDAGAPVPTRYDMLRGAYGPYRANNDLLYYHLDIRVDPDKQTVSGKNTVRFRMLKDGTRIQLDLRDTLNIDKILMGSKTLKYVRDTGAVFIDFPETLRAGQVYSIDFYYSGHPE